MLRHLAASWLFAGFLVVVAVATWRVLDARTPIPPTPPMPPTPPALVVAPVEPIALPVIVDAPTPPTPSVSSCGASHDPFAAPELSGTTPLQLGTQPFADLILDGKAMGSTPFYGPRRLDVTVGSHDLVFRDKTDGKRYRFRLDVTAVDPENKVIFVLHSRQWRTVGAVRVTPLDLKGKPEVPPMPSMEDLADPRGPNDLTTAQAEAMFIQAVDAFREKRTARACDLLETITDRTSPPERWREKAETLYLRRCAD